MNGEYDVLIVGGGMVGASLARALLGTGLRIAVVEAVEPGADDQPSYDDRVIALSWSSRMILQGIGHWDAIGSEAEPIRRIHISDRGHFGFARLDCRDHDVPALGYVTSARTLGRALLDGIESQQDLDWFCPARVADFQVEPQRVSVTLDLAGSLSEVSTRLLVAADGGDSPIRERLNLPVQAWNYGQTAVIANITPGKPHQGVAYERFTDCGPLAMLPMTEGRCSLVWTQPDDAVDQVLNWDDEIFLQQLQERFGFRLGRLSRVGRRVAYPLRLLRVKETVRPRLALIGNAAHTLHPVAGQGFNLGLRDVAVLADTLAESRRRGLDPGAMIVLDRYAADRVEDQRRMALTTDFLARLFANPLLPLRLGRDLGLLALDLVPAAKRAVTREFMGMSGRLSRLSRGLPLEL